MMIARGISRPVLGIAAIAVVFASAAFFSDGAQVGSEAEEPGMTSAELERRPIPGTDLEMRMDLVTQFPGYSGPVDHHVAPAFIYMLDGRAEGFYGEDDVIFGEDVVKHFQKGDHWPQSVDPQRISRNPDPKAARRFLVFTVTQPGAAGAARP